MAAIFGSLSTWRGLATATGRALLGRPQLLPRPSALPVPPPPPPAITQNGCLLRALRPFLAPRLATGIATTCAPCSWSAAVTIGQRMPGRLKPQHGGRSFSFYRQSFRQGGGDPNAMLYGLIASNVAVFALWKLPLLDLHTMQRHFTLGASDLRQGRLLNTITCAFSHNTLDHLFFNMLGLYVFGRPIAQMLGPARLLSFYVIFGMAGSAAFLVHEEWKARQRPGGGYFRPPFSQERRSLGASGAVVGLTTMYIFMFPQATILLMGIVPVPSWLFGLAYIGSDVSGMLDTAPRGGTAISHAAHLGGAAAGALCFAALRRGRLPF